MIIKHGSIISLDLDGTLCMGECFTDKDCIKAIPIWDMIIIVNDYLFEKKHCFINIHTARREYLRSATEFWLKKYEIKYHTLVMGKLWSQYYIDDRNVLIKELLEVGLNEEEAEG